MTPLFLGLVANRPWRMDGFILQLSFPTSFPPLSLTFLTSRKVHISLAGGLFCCQPPRSILTLILTSNVFTGLCSNENSEFRHHFYNDQMESYISKKKGQCILVKRWSHVIQNEDDSPFKETAKFLGQQTTTAKITPSCYKSFLISKKTFGSFFNERPIL